MRSGIALALVVFGCDSAPVAWTDGSGAKLVVWNAAAGLQETRRQRLSDFAEFAEKTDADVIVLVEMDGQRGVESFVEQLEWPEAYYVVSNFSQQRTQTFLALEMAVISKIRIENAIEYDASVDGVHGALDKSGQPILMIDEVKLRSDGIPHFGQTLAGTDRGTLRVDLGNGLSIFPVHLKSDRLSSCFPPREALELIEESDFDLSPERRANAIKRERVIAAIARVAQEAIDLGRHAVIAGDFNTAYEPGKKGNFPEDCTLTHFDCEKGPFPATACSDGDGYDDTFAILERGYAAATKWRVLSSRLKRTFADDAFADAAIDHIAVPVESASEFSPARRIDDLFGSDHHPITATFEH